MQLVAICHRLFRSANKIDHVIRERSSTAVERSGDRGHLSID